MKTRTKQKTVSKSLFGRFKEKVFGITKSRDEAISQKRDYHQTTEQQIRKMFRLQRENPNLSYLKIGKLVNVSEVVCRYWLKQNEEDVISLFKVKRGRKVTEKQKEKETVKVQKPATQAPKIESEWQKMTLTERLDVLDATEKYPEEHKLDGRIFGDLVDDERLLADPDKFKIRKIKNNGLRKIYAVLKNGSESERHEVLTRFENSRIKEMEMRHVKKEPRDHHGTIDCPNRCPCGHNVPSWIKKAEQRGIEIRVETVDAWIRKNHKQNWELQKYAEKMQKKEQELKKQDLEKENDTRTKAEKSKEVMELCLKCDKPLSYSQSSRTSSIWGRGQFYCKEHEPNSPPKKKRGK